MIYCSSLKLLEKFISGHDKFIRLLFLEINNIE